MTPLSSRVQALVRPNIVQLKPYRCARDDYQSGVLLDANENPHGPCLVLEPPRLGASPSPSPPSPQLPSTANLDSPTSIVDLALHRYPDPHQIQLKQAIAAYRNLPGGASHLFTGVGSDEAIDLLMRVFCVPANDAILTCSPTYGMYRVSASVNDVAVVDVPLTTKEFQLDTERICQAMREYAATKGHNGSGRVKLVFACSPGNPTGTALRRSDLLRLLNDPAFDAVLVVDEAYIDFVNLLDHNKDPEKGSMLPFVAQFPNLVVLQTLSKSFGLAGIRMGIAAASPTIIHYMNAVKPPYNISSPTAYFAQQAFSPASLAQMQLTVSALVHERQRLVAWFTHPETRQKAHVQCIRGGLDANFLLVQLQAPPPHSLYESVNAFAHALYKQLAEDSSENVVIRFRGNEPLCEGCLRISVGTKAENDLLLRKWIQAVQTLLMLVQRKQ